MPSGSFDPGAIDGGTQLNRIWLLELLQPWSPDGLPNSHPAAGLQLNYVALGDSYSAGEGAGAGHYFQTNGKDVKCHRATTAWSFVVAESSTQIVDPMLNVTCAGAKTQHVEYEWYKGEQPQLQALKDADRALRAHVAVTSERARRGQISSANPPRRRTRNGPDPRQPRYA